MPFLEKVAEAKGIRIVYAAPGATPLEFGTNNSDVLLKGDPIKPRAPVQEGLFDVPESSSKGSRGGRGPGVAGKAGTGLAVLGFALDIYYVAKYGPTNVFCSSPWAMPEFCYVPPMA